MKKILFLLLLCSRFCFAQAPAPQIEALMKKALAYEDKGDNANAFNTNLQIYNLDNNNYAATNTMAGIAGKMGDFNTEIIWAQKTIAIKPDYAFGYINLGNAYAGQHNFDKAIENYNIAARLDPKSPYPPYELGVIEEAKGDIKGAVACYERSAKLDPDFDNAWFNLAAGYANLKNFEGANRYITKFLNLHPDDKDAQEMQKHILMAIKAMPFRYPAIPKAAKTLEGFVPVGWKLKDKAVGDLNADKIADAALVLEYQDVVNEARSDNDTIQSHPRVLLVLLKTGDHYSLVAQQNTFILRETEGGPMYDGDPYDNIEITKGALNINFQYIRSHLNYKFKYQAGDFYLIKAIDDGVESNIIFDNSFDFLTRKASLTSGASTEEGSKAKNKTHIKTINIPRLKKLTELKQPYAWEVIKDEFI
jgi:tetratricopeptide (TPR) repeat protein